MFIAVAADSPHAMLLTMATAIAAGSLLTVAARRFAVPAIVLLLLGGMLLGPEIWGDHALLQPESLGDGLFVFVSMAVGLILFEGGLTLDLSGYRAAPAMIKRLLTIGVIITWFGTAIAIRFIIGTAWDVAIVAGSLVIVTGPTVIAPLLKRIKVVEKLHNILHWEGVLIDPIGVFIALLCFEWISGASGAGALANLGVRVVAGLAIGVPGGWLLAVAMRRRIVPEETINVFALGFAVLVFGVAEYIVSEAGLLSVTVAGFVFGLTRTPRVKQVRQFKAEITDLLIGTLFMLLAARLSLEQFREFGWDGVVLLGIVILLVRPLSILLCSIGVGLSAGEKLFLSWVAPRGIVAASMASLIAISMERLNQPGAIRFANPAFVETFTYSVIVATIVLQGSTAGVLTRVLKLRRPVPTGWLVVGAHELARRVADFISRTAEKKVIVVDSNGRAVRETAARGITAYTIDARDPASLDRREFRGIGHVLALTDNEDLNVRICQTWRHGVGPDNVFRCNPSGGEIEATDEEEEETAGIMVWPRLPRPSLLSAELQRGDTMIEQADGYGPQLHELSTPLVYVDEKGRVQLPPPAPERGDEPLPGKMLYVRRKADYLMRAIRPELITTLHDVGDLKSLFDTLVDRVTNIFPAMPREETVEELLERETSFPTVLGHGVAVPHAFSGALDARVCAVARVPEGMRFSQREGEEPVTLVFLLISPQGDPEGHLATLAEIARLVIQPQVRERLKEVEAPLEVVRTIRDAMRM